MIHQLSILFWVLLVSMFILTNSNLNERIINNNISIRNIIVYDSFLCFTITNYVHSW